MDQVSKIMAFESGGREFDATVEVFQELIDSGLVWQLQGSYGRMASSLIENGYCDV